MVAGWGPGIVARLGPFLAQETARMAERMNAIAPLEGEMRRGYASLPEGSFDELCEHGRSADQPCQACDDPAVPIGFSDRDVWIRAAVLSAFTATLRMRFDSQYPRGSPPIRQEAAAVVEWAVALWESMEVLDE